MAGRLPPGQHAIRGFPRFGTHLHRRPPAVPEAPAIEIAGAVREAFSVPLTEFAKLPRRVLEADFHCAAGWTAIGLQWQGVEFDTFYELFVAPQVEDEVTHLSFIALDGFRSIITREDAFGRDLLLADRLHGRALDADHGAPLRLVSPHQYGYKSTKHLCRVEVHTSEPPMSYHHLDAFSRLMLRSPLIGAHLRARVWEEERHPYMPAKPLRPLYFYVLRPPLRFLSELPSRRGRG